MGMTPPLSLRGKDIGTGIALLIPASFVTFSIGWGIYNVFNGTAKLPGAFFALVVVGILDGFLLLVGIINIQPRVTLYADHLRLGYLPGARTIIAFKDIDKMLNIQDGQCKSYFGFIMRDGYRFIIPTERFDENFTKEFLNRLASAGIKPAWSLYVDESERFLYPKTYEIRDLEDRLLKQAREGKSG